MIQVKHLSKSFSKIRAVQDISFDVKPGEILGLLGPNGAGKTTTMRMLAGFFPPSAGHVLVDEKDLHESPVTIRRRIGYLPENVPLYRDLVTIDFLNYVATLKGVSRRERKKCLGDVIEQCGLGSVRERIIGKLSKGYRQRIGLAQALIGNPSLLILDEPTSGLDPKQIIEIRQLIKTLSANRTVILSTHILPEVSMICSRVLIIHEGSVIASGTPGELEQQLRHSSELAVQVRGTAEGFEQSVRQVPGILAIRIESSKGQEYDYRIIYKKNQDVRPLVSRSVVASGLELLGMQQVSMTLEDIFLRIVVQEEADMKADV
ncbi:MAG: MFS transporter [Candidatus Omnitrophica bacterium CG11_big_fil_rev_8_21_14_0_20_45_26]|uniref:MFS transporter n=1 Tax=Candidatus Abzuiibacterium crystallinum TaxID=1974748 RepID=A0A2H0LSK6_9BACT|nr:MAG: MFS transporter [Candidatus Omnitrophica bacterium CG11_big_fil_rev_8_21_14_0_20_45_26]PIW64058.1 MAG: MFS transporter [Candidatus Omnitrophica bacterium CG12_big_fil_rev_8_21_14_0_65_45_16]